MAEFFSSGGRSLYESLTQDSDSEATRTLIVEACRAKDRLDRLNALTSGEADSWCRIFTDSNGGELTLKIDTALTEQRQLSTVFRQLLNEISERQGGGDDDSDDSDPLGGF